jgi:PAS domain S-box-containing protein
MSMVTGSGEIRVVHLDDDPEFLELTKEIVERHNDAITVVSAEEATGALERVREGGVHCVVTDYKMAGMDGLSFLEEIREHDPDLPVIFFTGKGTEEVASEAISMGVTDYLQKGSGTEQFQLLSNRVANLVNKRRAEEEAHRADERIREVYERITIAFFALDANYRFTYLNSEASDLFGYPETELLGERIWDVFHGLVDSEFEARLRRSMDEQAPEVCDGVIDSLDKHVEMHAYPAENGVSVFAEDITEEVEREREVEQLREELEISEEQFRILRTKLSRPTSLFR